MVNVLLIGLLFLGFLIGLKRGFILQFFHLIGFVVAYFVAVSYYDDLAPRLALWVPYPDLSSDRSWAVFLESLPLESGFYNAISFAIIFFATKIILQIVAAMLDFVAALPVLNSFNKLLGALLGFVEVYLILFVILFILALTPIGSIQDWIDSSRVALWMIEKTPFLSEKIRTLWLTHVENILQI